MNRAQRKVGWWFVIILFVLVEFFGWGYGLGPDGEFGGVLLGIAGIVGLGVWAFIAAGSKGKDS